MEISKKTIEVLKDAGWYEGRKIDIAENVKFLEERGFEVLESAKKFMEEFGELEINIEEIETDGTIEVSEHTTRMVDVVGDLDSDWFGLENYISEKVVPIGMLYDSEMFLYISESGRVFSSIGWEGDSVWEAWENIINEKGIIWSKFLKYYGIINGMKVEVSEKTMKVLKHAGWYEGRKIDITETVKSLEERGFEVFESAKKFMEEFGELNIKFEHVRRNGRIDRFKDTTCMVDVVGDLDSSHFGLEEHISEKVMPIGKLDNGAILYISESGRIFSSRGWEGDNAWEAFNNSVKEKGTIVWDNFKE